MDFHLFQYLARGPLTLGEKRNCLPSIGVTQYAAVGQYLGREEVRAFVLLAKGNYPVFGRDLDCSILNSDKSVPIGQALAVIQKKGKAEPGRNVLFPEHFAFQVFRRNARR